jgi:hypothetical protein
MLLWGMVCRFAARPSPVFGMLAAWLAASAEGQDLPRAQTVTTRERPEVTATGVAVGAFTVSPKLTLSGLYDDNVLAAPNDSQSTFRLDAAPEISAHSNWAAHALNLLASANYGRNRDFSSEDYNDWQLSADGRVDIDTNVNLASGVGRAHDHLDRASPNDANGIEPTRFDRSDAFLRYEHHFGRLSLHADASGTRWDFIDVLGVRNGAVVLLNQDDRDRTDYEASVRFGYEIQPGYDAYVRVTRERRDYETLQDFIDADRSSLGREVAAGIALDFDGVTFGEIFVGYRAQDYLDPYPDIDTPLYGGALHWNPSGVTTVSATLQRSIAETTTTLFSGYTNTDSSVSVDHELRRDILLNAGVHYGTDDYEGIGTASRKDRTTDLVLKSTFLLNRNLQVAVQYEYLRRQSRDSTALPTAPNDFRKNILLFQVGLQL